jgi:hypothetical protein
VASTRRRRREHDREDPEARSEAELPQQETSEHEDIASELERPISDAAASNAARSTVRPRAGHGLKASLEVVEEHS